jgi:hypothetical protein
LELDAWGEVFADAVIAGAIVDSLPYHSITIKSARPL